MLKELIKAIYEIAKAIKWDDGNGGEGNSNDNGLYGADGIIVTDGVNPQEDNKVFLSQKELFDDFKENVDKYINDGIGRNICFLYTKNNIDKLLKPTEGMIIKPNGVSNKGFQFYITFLDEYILESYNLLSIQDHFEEPDIQKVAEKLGNNVYFFMTNLTPRNPFEPSN